MGEDGREDQGARGRVLVPSLAGWIAFELSEGIVLCCPRTVSTLRQLSPPLSEPAALVGAETDTFIELLVHADQGARGGVFVPSLIGEGFRIQPLNPKPET